MKHIPFVDLHLVTEDERIKMIGEAASQRGVIGVLLEKNEPEKVARYIKKVTERYPHVELMDQTDGPTSLTVTLRFRVRQ